MGQHILVCSAHIHWDPEFCDVKLIQTMMLMERLREITETFGHDFRPDRHKKGSDNVHLLLCAGKKLEHIQDFKKYSSLRQISTAFPSPA